MEKVDKSYKELIEYLEAQKSDDSAFVKDEVEAKGISVRIGNRLLKFDLSSEETLPIDDIKIDLNRKYIDNLQKIKEFLEKSLIESYQTIEVYKNEAEEKKLKYEKLLSSERHTPELSYDDIKKGLSVCKDDESGLIWLFKGVYSPKYFYTISNEQKYISPKHFKELITPINIQIRTKAAKVTSVVVLDIFGNKFKHYHDTGGSDCWGDWSYSRENCNTSDEIISIANKALNILETINENSPGNREPRNLPKLKTLKNSIIETLNKDDYLSKQSSIYKRLGLSNIDFKVLEVKRHTSRSWTTGISE